MSECDNCALAPGQVIEPFGITCACSVGQGADAEDCICGPEGEDR